MKLPIPEQPQNLAEQLAEFDIWITPSLGEIRDTERFKEELAKIVEVFDALAASTNQFRSIDECSPEAITSALLALVHQKPNAEAATILHGAASLLFLSTGKSDNNAKCQLPLHLRDSAKWAGFPALRTNQKSLTISSGKIPRVLPSDDYMAVVSRLGDYQDDQKRLLLEYVRFLLSDKSYIAQLWSIGHSYAQLKAFKREKDLLTPLVIFQVRGSVSATGGHAPERLLRERFAEWGLIKDVDYNVADVVVAEEKSKGGRIKTRAYDFVLPFKTPGFPQRVFVQSQFYAGDSGSVSHKNVDQTSTSRSKVTAKNKEAVFVEYLDGAGYFSSLNGDLKTLLSMPSTNSFVQVRSATIRLRRVLQEIGFCTPLEIEHAIARTNGQSKNVVKLLLSEGYSKKEIGRCIECALKCGIITESKDTLSIIDGRRSIVRRYFVLDTIACKGRVITSPLSGPLGYLMVPGYGPFFGLKKLDTLNAAIKSAPGFSNDLADSRLLLGDMQWLEEQRFMLSS